MPLFKLHVKRTIHGEAEVEAKNLEEAKIKFENGEEKYFYDYSEDYPIDWIVDCADIYNEEIEEWEEV